MTMPLEGIKVLDWTQFQQGPAATQMLGDLGADVIKIEDRVRGDGGRGFTTIMGAATGVYGRNYYFETLNRNKRSITLDLAKERGRQIAYRLVERSDVFVHNYRKSAAKRLGMDYDSLRQCNRRIIYAVASSFGPQGPEADATAFDIVGQARSGIMKPIEDPELIPTQSQPGIADQMGAIMLAYGIMVALLARERHGMGQEVDVSLLGSMMALQTVFISGALVQGIQFPRATRETIGNPLYNYYRCQDGKWICLGMVQSDRHWANFCRAVGREDLATDERCSDMFKRASISRELIAALDETFATRPRDEWLKLLRERGNFAIAPVNTYLDLADDPQVLANEYIVEYEHPAFGSTKTLGLPITLGETPGGIKLPAPKWGQHTEEVLMEMGGLSWEEIVLLKEEEVI